MRSSDDDSAHANAAMIPGDPEIVTATHILSVGGESATGDKEKPGQGDGSSHATRSGIQFRAVPALESMRVKLQPRDNAMYCFVVDGVRLVHFGDVGNRLERWQLEQMGGVDVAIVPRAGHQRSSWMTCRTRSTFCARPLRSRCITTCPDASSPEWRIAGVHGPLSAFSRGLGAEAGDRAIQGEYATGAGSLGIEGNFGGVTRPGGLRSPCRDRTPGQPCTLPAGGGEAPWPAWDSGRQRISRAASRHGYCCS